jgi:RNA-binding protein
MKKGVKKEKLNKIKVASAQIIIGKNGLTEDALENIKKRLKKDKILKVKLLKTAPEFAEMNRKEFADTIARNTNANLLEVRGYSVILQKKQS